MNDPINLSADLTDLEWLAEIEELSEERGYFTPLGEDHAALFHDESLDVLLVCFDTIDSARQGSVTGLPHGMSVAAMHGWSYLSVVAKTRSWFRDKRIYGYFDRLIDDGFFEEFDRVVFYGAGMCGYAAATYSVVAPGATVIAVAPQATLDPRVTGWDDRFVQMRRTSFTDRYGYAPYMLEACKRAFVLYDPEQEMDAMHAALFTAPYVDHVPLRHFGPRPADALRAMNILAPMLEHAVAGTLEPGFLHRALRKRRDHLPYLRQLLNRVHIEERHFLTALLCRAVLDNREAPRFRHHYDVAMARLQAEGRSLPERRTGGPRTRLSSAGPKP